MNLPVGTHASIAESLAFQEGQLSLINAGWKSPEEIHAQIMQNNRDWTEAQQEAKEKARQQERERVLREVANACPYLHGACIKALKALGHLPEEAKG